MTRSNGRTRRFCMGRIRNQERAHPAAGQREHTRNGWRQTTGGRAGAASTRRQSVGRHRRAVEPPSSGTGGGRGRRGGGIGHVWLSGLCRRAKLAEAVSLFLLAPTGRHWPERLLPRRATHNNLASSRLAGYSSLQLLIALIRPHADEACTQAVAD